MMELPISRSEWEKGRAERFKEAMERFQAKGIVREPSSLELGIYAINYEHYLGHWYMAQCCDFGESKNALDLLPADVEGRATWVLYDRRGRRTITMAFSKVEPMSCG